jgi:hypothetical protein
MNLEPSIDSSEHPIYPIYQIEKSDAELHLWPISGGKVGIAVIQKGVEIYRDVIEYGFWQGGNRRNQIASRVASVLDVEDKDAIKMQAKMTIDRISLDEGTDWFEASMRTSQEEDIRRRTVKVVVWTGEQPEEDDPTWVVTLRPPDESSEQTPLKLTLTSRQMLEDNSDYFNSKHAEAFDMETNIDSGEWDSLIGYWNDIQVLRKEEWPKEEN